jgi:hypothetical protein
MPRTLKQESGSRLIPQRTSLKMPAIGMESEFNVWLDEVEIIPENYWKHPRNFIDVPMLAREKTSSHIPTGGAVYFDRGVIEVVTPVIELGEESTARMVRNLWESMQFVRDQLTLWEKKAGHTVRLKGYSSHYNISYEIPKSQQNAHRNEKKLALLLTYLLPVPVMLVAANRRSTGIGVRPRGGRIEITSDFTPDPGLMVAAATLIAGIVREVMSWPSYELSVLQERRIPVIDGVVPGKHTTRKGWLTKDFHYPQSPFTSDIDAPLWKTQLGETKSLRQIGAEVAWIFRKSIRRYSDPFSFRLLFAILEGRAASLLELVDRPTAYEDVGRLCRWGSVIHELKNYRSEMNLIQDARQAWGGPTIDEFVTERERERQQHLSEMANVASTEPRARKLLAMNAKEAKNVALLPETRAVRITPSVLRSRSVLSRRRSDTPGKLVPPRTMRYLDRRAMPLLPAESQRRSERRRGRDRRKRLYAMPFPDRRLTRSAYEQVFLKLVSGGRLRLGNEMYRPVGMKGWYQAIFRRESDGRERLMSIDQLLQKMGAWV